MLQIHEDGQHINNQVAADGAHTCQQGANLGDVQRANQWEHIDANRDAEGDGLAWLLGAEEKTQDKIVQEVCDQWIRREKQEEDR